jgi:hypothetical protein
MDSTKFSPTSVTDAKVLELADTTVQNFFKKPYLGPSSPAAVAVAATPKLSPSCWRHTPTTPQTERVKKEKTLRQQINSRDRMSRKQLMSKKRGKKTYPPGVIKHKPPSNPHPKESGGRKTKRRRKHKLRKRKKRKSRKKHRKKRSTRKR